MKIILADPTLFAAALRFLSSEETRYYLHGVYLEPAEGGGALLSATDGRVMFHGYDDLALFPGELGPVNIIPEKRKLPAACLKQNASIEIDLIGGGITCGDFSMGFVRAQEDYFPPYRNVWPKEREPEQTPVQYKPKDVRCLADAAKILGVDHPHIRPNGSEAAWVTFDRQDAFGLIMPFLPKEVPAVPYFPPPRKAQDVAA